MDSDQAWLALGAALRDLRISREWTQADLAERTGIPLSSISAYERAERHAPLDMLVSLCAAFDLLLTEFFDGMYPYGARSPSSPAVASSAQRRPK